MDTPTVADRDTAYYDASFPRMGDELYAAIRQEAFGEDIGQYSWLSADEHAMFVSWLGADESSDILEIASGSGGPTLRMARTTGSRVTGVDLHADGVATATAAAQREGLADRVRFMVADAREPLPFGSATFDAAICLDSINHVYERGRLVSEWYRVLRPGGRLVFTNPITVTGLLTREEMVIRSGSMGDFVFTAPGVDRALLESAGFMDIEVHDATATEAEVAAAWHAARARHKEELDGVEGPAANASFQQFLLMVATLAAEGRLSRLAYRARKG